jgi:hypothetical protein
MSLSDTIDNQVTASSERWFDDIERCSNPWRYWLGMLEFSPYNPCTDEEFVERYVEDACRAADNVRLRVVPRTQRFTDRWAAFRRHHEDLEDSAKYRRTRWLIWRAAALRTALDFNLGITQDEADARIVHVKLAQTMRELGPYDANGYCADANEYRSSNSNFWRASTLNYDGQPKKLGPLHQYAEMVLVLVTVTVRDWR